MTHRAQNLIAALAIATFATGAFAQNGSWSYDFSEANPSADTGSNFLRDGFGAGPGPDGNWWTGDEAMGNVWTTGTGGHWDTGTTATGGNSHTSMTAEGWTDSTRDASDDAWRYDSGPLGLRMYPTGVNPDNATPADFNYWGDDIIDVELGVVDGGNFEGWRFGMSDFTGFGSGGHYGAGFNTRMDQTSGELVATGYDVGSFDPGTRPYKWYTKSEAATYVELDNNGNPFDRDGDGHIIELHAQDYGGNDWADGASSQQPGEFANFAKLATGLGNDTVEFKFQVRTDEVHFYDETKDWVDFIGDSGSQTRGGTIINEGAGKENLQIGYFKVEYWADGLADGDSSNDGSGWDVHGFIGIGIRAYDYGASAAHGPDIWSTLDYLEVSGSDGGDGDDPTPSHDGWWELALAGDADRDGDIDFSENPLGSGDGQSDLNILNNNAGTTTGATWAQGDFDGDGDVDFTENPLGGGDGTSDLNILNSQVTIGPNGNGVYDVLVRNGVADDLGAADLGEDNAGGTGTAELVYDYATGKVWIETADATINTIELFTDGSTLVIDTGAVGNLNGTAPNDLNSSALQYFVSSGLPTGESLIGQILPGNLTEGDVVLGTNLLFRFARAGEAPQSGVVTLIPEPTSIALLGLGGLALLRRRRA